MLQSYQEMNIRLPGSKLHMAEQAFFAIISCWTAKEMTAKNSLSLVRRILVSSRTKELSCRPRNSRGTGPLIRRCSSLGMSCRWHISLVRWSSPDLTMMKASLVPFFPWSSPCCQRAHTSPMARALFDS